MRAIWILAIAIVAFSTACSSGEEAATAESDPSTEPVTEAADAAPTENAPDEEVPAIADPSSLDEEGLRALARDPEAMREVMQDPERRKALRERMQELRGQRTEGDRTERREAMRERAERFRERGMQGKRSEMGGRAGPRWWTNETVASELALTDEQSNGLDSAYEQFSEVSRSARQELARVTQVLPEAISPPDRDRLTSLLQEREAALASRRQAESAWMQDVLETLSDEQLETLAANHPDLLKRLVSPQ